MTVSSYSLSQWYNIVRARALVVRESDYTCKHSTSRLDEDEFHLQPDAFSKSYISCMQTITLICFIEYPNPSHSKMLVKVVSEMSVRLSSA